MNEAIITLAFVIFFVVQAILAFVVYLGITLVKLASKAMGTGEDKNEAVD